MMEKKINETDFDEIQNEGGQTDEIFPGSFNDGSSEPSP